MIRAGLHPILFLLNIIIIIIIIIIFFFCLNTLREIFAASFVFSLFFRVLSTNQTALLQLWKTGCHFLRAEYFLQQTTVRR